MHVWMDVCVYVCDTYVFENVLMLLKILLGKLLENVFILVFIYWLPILKQFENIDYNF